MKFYTAENVRLLMPKTALITVFDECDQFDQDETGGRVIGTFEEHSGELVIRVGGIIEAGPLARRSPVSFFQDGGYQERIFREIEDEHREIEHLGNWHTHHVNRLQHLSSGDIETYYRTVNHRQHNTSFFYALLVTAKHRTSDPLRRYTVKHYIFRRGDEQIYELRRSQIEILDAPLIWPVGSRYRPDDCLSAAARADPDRAYDNDILREFFQGVRAFSSPKLGVYWRGPLDLLDGSKLEVVVVEDLDAANPIYTVILRDPPAALKNLAEEISAVEFPSARAALIRTERDCNLTLYRQHGGARRIDLPA